MTDHQTSVLTGPSTYDGRMTGQKTLVVGNDRFRIGPRRGSTEIASMVPLPGAGQVQQESLHRTIDALRQRGFRHVITSALGPRELDPFLRGGFTPHHELHLLTKQLGPLAPPDRTVLRRARRGDWDNVLAIDAVAFTHFWQFDRVGLRDALDATPQRRFQVVRSQPTVGYHIAGLAGSSGYLQRLAVHPGEHGRGLGSALLTDALSWMHRRGARIAYVNTQLENRTALDLYLRNGFDLEHQRLTVLQRPIDA